MTQRARQRPLGAPTITEIARSAGVTVPLVSKVLNGRSDVSPTVRESIGSLLEAAGYSVPEVPGTGRATEGLVDLVVTGVEGSWASVMLAGVEGVVSKAGRDLAVTVAREGEPAERDWDQRLIDRGSRGAVLALVTPTSAQHERLAAAGVHLVALDPGQPTQPGIRTVGATNWAGGNEATDYVISLGHERIAALGGLQSHRFSQARLDGYRSALETAGLSYDADLVRHADWSSRSSRRHTEELLDLPDRPTAIFACSDRMALGAYAAAARRGLRIPDDLSIIGFDDLPEAQWLTPALTTIRQPVREMGAAAARMLMQVIDGEPEVPSRLELATSLVERDSTSPPLR